MNQNTTPSADQHQQSLLLLPWYLNQSLGRNERQLVGSHIRSCILCRRELVNLRKLSTAVMQSSDLDVAAETSFASLRAKLQTTQPIRQKTIPSVNRPTLAWFGKHENSKPGLSGNAANRHSRLLHLSGVKHFALAASLLLAMIPLMMQYGRSPVTADYYTLSSAKPEAIAGSKLRVVFSKSLPDVAIDSLLAQIHGHLLDGPNSVGAYTVRLDADQNTPDLTTAIALLRNQQDVMLAEPVIEP